MVMAGSVIDDADIARAAYGAGFRGDALITAIAVALAESAGRADARGDTGLTNTIWGPSVGLWQVRSLQAQRGTGKSRDELANVDPAANARAAYEISQGGTNWRPWTVARTGAYRTFVARAETAIAGLAGAQGIRIPGTSVNIPNPFEVPGDVLGGAAGAVLEGIKPIALTLLAATAGALLIVLGLWRSASGARDSAGAALTAVPDPRAQAAGAVIQAG